MQSAVLCYLLMLSCFSFPVEGQMRKFMDKTPEIIKDAATAAKDWEQMGKALKNTVNEGAKILLPSLEDGKNSLNISASCAANFVQVIAGMKKLETWAMRFLDSSAKGVDGLLTGSTTIFGAYDECIETVAVNEEYPGKEEVIFTGKYCILRIKAPLPPAMHYYSKEGVVVDELKDFFRNHTVLSELAKRAPELYMRPIRLGLCVPSSCSVEDINQLFAKASDYTRLYMKVKKCEVKEAPKFTPLKIFIMSLYCFSGILVLFSTLADTYCDYTGRQRHSIIMRLLQAFSFTSNCRKLMNTSSSSKHLRCLNGIRFITMAWVINAHTFILPAIFQIYDVEEPPKRSFPGFAFQIISASYFSVETFFFLGGFLVCYHLIRYVKIAKKSFSVKLYILHRLWRLLPTYVFVMLYIFLADLVSSGPAAHDVIQPFVEGCERNWWTNLLFINNLYHSDNMCLPHTWYLSVDTQLYIGALVIILPLLRWPRVGITIAVLCILCSMLSSGLVTYMMNYPPTFMSKNVDVELIFSLLTELYFKPYIHIGAYVIGMLTGYFVATYSELKIHKGFHCLGWCCAIIFNASSLFGGYEWTNGSEPTTLETVFYAGCGRVAWAVSIAWMVVSCTTGHGGIVNHILSWKVWIPLGRLTYSAYLVHILIQLSYIAILKSPVDPTPAVTIWMCIGHVGVTYVIAFAVNMLVESPLLAIEKLSLPRSNENGMDKTANDTIML